jgi:drug/metabolite transporter (DMT)-like permease
MKLEKKYIIILAIFACLLWSTAFAGVKIGFEYMPKPFTFAGMRFTLAGLILLPFAIRKNSLEQFIENKVVILYVVFLNTAIGYALYYTAMSFVGGATAAIIVGSGPLLTGIMTHFLMENDKMDKYKIFSITLGLIGILIIILHSKPMTPVGQKEAFGILLLLANSILTSYVNIKVAQIKKGISSTFLTANQMFWGGLLLLGGGRIFEGQFNFNQPIKFYVALLWLAFVSAVAFSIWFFLIQQQNIKVSELNMFKYFIPVSGAIISWTLLPNESPNLVSIIGMGFVFAALIVNHIFSKS